MKQGMLEFVISSVIKLYRSYKLNTPNSYLLLLWLHLETQKNKDLKIE